MLLWLRFLLLFFLGMRVYLAFVTNYQKLKFVSNRKPLCMSELISAILVPVIWKPFCVWHTLATRPSVMSEVTQFPPFNDEHPTLAHIIFWLPRLSLVQDFLCCSNQQTSRVAPEEMPMNGRQAWSCRKFISCHFIYRFFSIFRIKVVFSVFPNELPLNPIKKLKHARASRPISSSACMCGIFLPRRSTATTGCIGNMLFRRKCLNLIPTQCKHDELKKCSNEKRKNRTTNSSSFLWKSLWAVESEMMKMSRWLNFRSWWSCFLSFFT